MRLRPLSLEELPGWSPDELQAIWPAFLASAEAIVADRQPLRAALTPAPQMIDLCQAALALADDAIGRVDFFRQCFQPMEVLDDAEKSEGFVTGYYEPEIDGAMSPSDEFSAPVIGRPGDLVDMRGAQMPGWDKMLEGARRTASGALEPYPTRAQIENGVLGSSGQPILWLRDHVEIFFAQVQGSARIRLPDGARKRLVYAGRNGRPYTSIGRILIGRGDIPADEMSLARCKQWLRANGLERGDRGRAVLQSNESYVFFRLEDDLDPSLGPIGGQGVPLVPHRSIAVDRAVWSYGTPVWIGADLSSAGLGHGPTGRLLIAQDTGSAIVGPARGDLFIGAGDRAGAVAGLIRHSARFFVFAPVGVAGDDRT